VQGTVPNELHTDTVKYGILGSIREPGPNPVGSRPFYQNLHIPSDPDPTLVINNLFLKYIFNDSREKKTTVSMSMTNSGNRLQVKSFY
jgi:hypothetical protein